MKHFHKYVYLLPILFVLLFDYAIYLLNSQVVGILFKFIQFTYVSLIVQKFHFQQLMFALNLLSRKSVLDSYITV